MAYFPNSFQKMLVASYATPFKDGNGTTDKTLSLAPGQVGIINSATNAVVELPGAPTYALFPMIYLAQGSTFANDKIGPFHGGYQETVKSKGINPKYVSAFWKTSPENPLKAVVNVSAAGCELLCGKTYRLRVDIKGSPALRALTHNIYRVMDANTGCCVGGDATSIVDPNMVFFQWKEQINEYPLLKDFILAKVWNTPTDLLTGLTGSIDGTPAATNIVTLADTSDLFSGMLVTGPSIPELTYVGVIVPNTSIALVDANGDDVMIGVDITAQKFYFKEEISLTPITKTKVQAIAIDPTLGSATVLVTNAAKAFITVGDVVSASGITDGTTVSSKGADDSGGAGFSNIVLSAVATSSTNVTATFTTTTTTAAYEYVVAADADNVVSHIELNGAYASTQFGDCSFKLKDNYEIEPVRIYASVVDDLEDVCNISCLTVSDAQVAKQGRGYGESLLRELILDKEYAQEFWSSDTRLREILGDTSLTNIPRGGKYYVYYILHNIPIKSNPSGVLDSDQYLIKIVIPETTFSDQTVTDFETWMETWLASANNAITCKNIDTGV